jgi:hypothetical protein
MAALLGYGLLTMLTIWASARDNDLRWVGAALGASFALSNVTWFLGNVTARPGLYTMLEMFVALAAYLAWDIRREKALVLVVVASTMSICANIALAIISEPSNRQLRIHETVTNICFAAECLLVLYAGVADGYRTGRFPSRLVGGGNRAEQDAAREAGE